jgi:hypothetical protein
MPDAAIEAINGIRDMVFLFMAIALSFSFTGVVVARSFANSRSSRKVIWQLFSATGVLVALLVSRRFIGQ